MRTIIAIVGSTTAKPLLLTLLLSSCAPTVSGPSPAPWQKAGANEQKTARDDAQCREAAREEALLRYPYRAGSPSLGPAGAIISQQQDDSSRAIAEVSLLKNCMQGKGY